MSKAGNDGVTKLAALKSAAQKFVAYVLSNPSFAQGTKIAIVPFSSAVAVDPTAYASAPWVDTEGTGADPLDQLLRDVGGRVQEPVRRVLEALGRRAELEMGRLLRSQPYPQNVTDMATNGPASLYVPYLAPDEGGPGRVGGYYTYFPSYWNLSYNSYIDDDDGTDNGTCPKQSASYPRPRPAAASTRIRITHGPALRSGYRTAPISDARRSRCNG